MNARGIALLLAILVALCAGYWFMLHSEQTRQIEAEEAKRLFAFAPDDLTRITIAREYEPVTVGERDANGAWRVAKPYEIEANPIVWPRVATALAELKNERTIEADPQDLAKYKLDKPLLEVTGLTKSGEEVRVKFGVSEPSQTKRFALAPSGEVILVRNTQVFELNRPLTDLRQRYLLSRHEDTITRIEYTRIRARQEGDPEPSSDVPPELAKGYPLGTVVFELDEEGLWQITFPEEAFADQELVSKMVSMVQFAAGEEFIDAPESLADYELDPPGARLKIYMGNNEPQTVYFGGVVPARDKPAYYCKRGEYATVLTVDAAIVDSFPEAPDSFRDKRLYTGPASELAAILYESGDTRIRFENDPERGWRIAEPSVEDPDQTAISNFISAVKGAEGGVYHGPKDGSFGFDTPTLKLTFTYSTDRPAGEVVVGAKAGEAGLYFAKQDRGGIMFLSESGLTPLQRTLFHFRMKDLLRFDAKKVKRVEVSLDGEAHTFEFINGRWRVTNPATKMLENDSDMQLLLDAVGVVRALGVAAPGPGSATAAYGLDSPVLKVKAVTDENEKESETPELRIGGVTPEDSQRRYAVVDGRPEVFLVDQEVVSGVRDAFRGVIPMPGAAAPREN